MVGLRSDAWEFSQDETLAVCALLSVAQNHCGFGSGPHGLGIQAGGWVVAPSGQGGPDSPQDHRCLQ
jgi:hypothetical protein